ncbi:MAG: EAL domain-containing protein, partial [Lachnospiraceae bacterium]|nr:EAL domain-containing protein [Lachnospiraceae bacterium]
WMVMTGPSIAIQNAKKTMNNLVVLTEDMLKKSNHVQQVENAFRHALEKEEFRPFLQPKVNMVNGEIVGAEVLSRWLVDGSVVPPDEFIPILEQTREIAELDLYILERACREIKRWYDAGIKVVPLSVNISRKDLDLPDLSGRIIDTIDRYAVNHRDLVIEITETENARENSVMMDFLRELADAGIRTSIDDFGTGYSSLSFLRDFPVGEIKIDRSFINHQVIRDKDRIIIGSIIDMAARLGVDVITEGVETKEQVAFLTELHCYRAQGFLYDRPLPVDQFEKRLSEGPYRI